MFIGKPIISNNFSVPKPSKTGLSGYYTYAHRVRSLIVYKSSVNKYVVSNTSCKIYFYFLIFH